MSKKGLQAATGWVTKEDQSAAVRLQRKGKEMIKQD